MKEKKQTELKKEITFTNIEIDRINKTFDYFKEKPEVETGTVDDLSTKKDKLKHLGFNNKRKAKTKQETAYLIKMLFLNATTKEYVINTKEPFFRLNKLHYMLVKEQARYNLNRQMYELIYCESYVLPINLQLIIENDNTATIEDGKNKVFMSITPHNLKAFIVMKFVDKVINPVDVDKWLKLVFFVAVVGAVLALINLVMKSGVMSNIGG